MPELLSQVDREIDRFIGDGMYDQAPVYAAVMVHSPGASVIIPPRKDAVLSDQAAALPTQRDQHLLAIEREGRFPWKRSSGYYAQSHTEKYLFPMQANLWRPIAGEARCVPGTGNLAGLRVAQSDARPGSS